jgi:hypothetical protein
MSKKIDHFFEDKVVADDVLLRAAKQKIQQQSRDDVASGAATQEDLFFISRDHGRQFIIKKYKL